MTDPAIPPSQPTTGPTPPPYPGPALRKSRRRTVLIVIGVLVALGLIGGIFAWRATAGAVDAANAFLSKTATEGPAAAWETASPAFKQNAPAAQWDAFAKQIGLTNYKSASWNNRQISNNIAHLEGTMTTQAGGTVPLTMELVKTDGKWLVQLINAPQSGFQTSSNAAAVSQTAQTPAPMGAGNVPPSGLVVDPNAGQNTSGWQTDPSANQSQGSLGSGSSVMPRGVSVPGAQVAGICMTMLQEKAGIKFDSIQCLPALPAQMGATIQCAISKGAQRGQMTVTVTGYDAATQNVQFRCVPGNPM